MRLAAVTLLLNSVAPELLAVKFAKALLLPIVLVAVIFPVPASRVKSWVPSTVPLRSILPPPVPVSKITALPRVVLPLIAIFWLAVVISALRVIFPVRVRDASPVPVRFPFTTIELLGDCIVVGSEKAIPALSIEIVPLLSERPIVIEAKPSAK